MYPSADHALEAELGRLRWNAERRRKQSFAALYAAWFRPTDYRGSDAETAVRLWREVIREAESR